MKFEIIIHLLANNNLDEEIMETSTINQLIESLGILISVFIALIFYLKAIRMRKSNRKEIDLLKDFTFYKALIEKYKDLASELDGKNYYITFRREVREETGFDTSRYSELSNIQKRLKELKAIDKKLEEFLSKLKTR